MKVNCSIEEGLALMNQGGIIAYPTEAVYGVGCSPFNQEAVLKLLRLKQRPVDKGLILLINDWQQLVPLIKEDIDLTEVKKTWPGHTTWLLPKSDALPAWLSGTHQTIAIRMSAHPVASALCANGPIVSTSANRSTEPPALTPDEVLKQFPHGVDAIIAGDLGKEKNPSQIYDAQTGKQLR